MTQDRRSNRMKPNCLPGRDVDACAATATDVAERGPNGQIPTVMIARRLVGAASRPMPRTPSRPRLPRMSRRASAEGRSAAFNAHSPGGGGSGLAQHVFRSPARIPATESQTGRPVRRAAKRKTLYVIIRSFGKMYRQVSGAVMGRGQVWPVWLSSRPRCARWCAVDAKETGDIGAAATGGEHAEKFGFVDAGIILLPLVAIWQFSPTVIGPPPSLDYRIVAIPHPAVSPMQKAPLSRWEHRYLGQELFPETLSALEIEHFFTLDEQELARVRERRGPLNRLALALHVGFLRDDRQHA